MSADALDFVPFAGDDTRRWVIAELRERLGDRVSTSASVLEAHGHDESYHPTMAPDAVVHVLSTEEVAGVLSLCHSARVPVVPYGAGTSLEGGVSAPYGGISLDLSRMDRILAVSADDLDATVQAGVTQVALNRHVQARGLFFSVDPGAEATLGGMCSTRASGTTAVRYGTMRENVLGLTAVLADGTVVRTGGHVRKSAAGYDLTRLLVGAEGTLAVITEVVLRLHPTPETVVAASSSFPDLESAVSSVVTLLQAGVTPARVELLDEVMVEAVVRYGGPDLPIAPAVFYELHGSPDAVAEQQGTLATIVEEHGGHGFTVAHHRADRDALWTARHQALPAAKALRPGASTWSTDVCVPISRLAECLLETKRDIDASGLVAPIAGHVGDGNFHLALVVDPDDDEEMGRARRLEEAMVARALRLGGTCSGEHGIGLGKMRHLAAEAGAAVDVMRAVKAALDPHGVLNPGKLFA